MKIRKKVSRKKVAHATNIPGVERVYKTADDVFGEEALVVVEKIVNENTSREVAIATIKETLFPDDDGDDYQYIAAVLEASFRNKTEAERLEDELQSNTGDS